MVSEYRLQRRVQFSETDAAGIVHFSWYPRYMEEAEHAMWRSAGLSIHEHDGDIGWPRLSIAFDFLGPLRFEDEFEVQIRIVAMTNKTIRYACDIVKDDRTVGKGSMTIVCVRRTPTEPAKSTDIPAYVTARLQVAAL